MDTEKDPQARFWVEAQVAVAKSSLFFALADDQIERGDLISGTICVYYSTFHLSLAMMWLLPDLIPDKLHLGLVEDRDNGRELPGSIISHEKIKDFLKSGEAAVLTQLSSLFIHAKNLREFVNYGPRCSYKGDQPLLGPCTFSTQDVKKVLSKLHDIFIPSLKWALPQTAYNGTLGVITVNGALNLLEDKEFPFRSWCSSSVTERARSLLTELEMFAGQKRDADAI